MEFNVYKETEDKSQKYFKLCDNDKNGIDLIAVNKDGVAISGGIILTINPNGIVRTVSVNKNLGLPIDERDDFGRVKICNC